MARKDYIRLVVLIVSILGLASCRKDGARSENVGGARTFSAPTVFSQGSHLDTTIWPKNYSRTSNLGEAVELGSPGPKNTQVHATCINKRGTISESKVFINESVIPFYRLIPEALLMQDLTEDPSKCSLTVQMSDDGMRLNGFQIYTEVEGDHGDLSLDFPGATGKSSERPRFLTEDLPHINITEQSIRSADAELSCQDASFPTVPFNSALNLGQLPISFPNSRSKDLTTLSSGGDQLCRVVLKDPNHNLRRMTKLFKLRFNKSPLDVKKTDDTWVHEDILHIGGTYHLAHYEVTNVDKKPQLFKFNQEWFHVKLRLNLKGDPNLVNDIDSFPWGRMFVDGPTGLKPVVAQDHFHLDSGQSMAFHLIYTPAGDIHCDHVRVRMVPTDKIYIQHLAEDGNISAITPLELPAETVKVQFQKNYKFDQKYERYDNGYCAF